MKKLVLTTTGDIKHAELASMFQSQGVTLVEREAHESETKELVFYCSPESYLAFFNIPESDIANKLTVWEKETLAQLDYVISNPERCLLIELEFAIENYTEFSHYIEENLNIVLTGNNIGCFDTTKQIQSCILLIDDDIQDTYEEITAAADLFNRECNQTVIERLSLYAREQQNKIDDKELSQVKHIEEVKKANAKCAEVEAELVTIKTKKEQFNVERAELNSANELALLQINQLQEGLKTAKVENESISADKKRLRNERTELKSENELTLLQIKQLQEELETIFVEKEESQIQHAKSIGKAKAIANNLTINLETAKVESESISADKKQLNSEVELALLQINQLQEELEATFVEKDQSQIQHTKAISEADAKAHDLTIKLETAVAENESISVDKEQLNSEKFELNSENEVALRQINQLQEELEVIVIEKEQSQVQYAKAIDESENKVNDLTIKLETAEAKKESLSVDKEQLNSEKSERNSENELALLQINQLQEEFEAIFTEKEQMQLLHAKAINKAETKVNELTAKLEDSKTENTNLSQEKDKLNTIKTEVNLDNELALLQINQLQEELEYYFIKLQNKKYQEVTLKIPVVNIAQMKASMQLVRLLK